MKQCIIADFEWCVTPYPYLSHFRYFNEILSAGAIRIDETGRLLDSMYTLIQPLDAAYLHPVILSSLSLDRTTLATAPSFEAFFDAFRAFCTADDGTVTPICTWGCADRASLLQNLRFKSGLSPEEAASVIPPMRDLQPILCRAAQIRQPYPSLASLLSRLRLDKTDEKSHNALADALGTARILTHFIQNEATRATVFPLFEESPSSACPKTDRSTAITTDIQSTPQSKRRRYPTWKKRQAQQKKAVPKT